jgi:prevent-host-death family protein
MQTYNIHDAKTNLSRLIDETVSGGEPFVIAKAGRPLVKVVRIETDARKPKRVGFMKGQLKIPDDFDSMGEEEIRRMFEGDNA